MSSILTVAVCLLHFTCLVLEFSLLGTKEFDYSLEISTISSQKNKKSHINHMHEKNPYILNNKNASSLGKICMGLFVGRIGAMSW